MNKALAIKIIALFVFVGFAYSASKTLYENWKINNEVKELKDQITELREANAELKHNIFYFQSESYREKIARERFGLQKPGEEVIVIVPEKKQVQKTETPKEKLSNPQMWWEYFFGAEE